MREKDKIAKFNEQLLGQEISGGRTLLACTPDEARTLREMHEQLPKIEFLMRRSKADQLEEMDVLLLEPRAARYLGALALQNYVDARIAQHPAISGDLDALIQDRVHRAVDAAVRDAIAALPESIRTTVVKAVQERAAKAAQDRISVEFTVKDA